MSSFSVIIPCYHDETRLAYLLRQLQNLRRLHRQPMEVIVVDGAADDACRKVCHEYSVRWVPGEPCRGRQLLAGAALAQGDKLWFLHADNRLSPGAIVAMECAFEQGASGGYFRFRFDAPRAWPALLLEPAIAFRCRFGVPYGDQGLFMTRRAYEETGGHSPWPLFEEVSLVRGLRRLGRFLPLREPILIDSRRWQRDGWWYRTWVNRNLALAFARGAAPDKLAARYRSRTV
ncbi:TIGR04283 family arsenosugar biosynthesis glycosyltransferase [Nitrosovibrio sp. Nv6]|uniref:TIGR04283 family arsenosugar biosynthesis glycosyltransferase n=1 Tax=Nitrosovibrio sp. Nv6 TaxID=1855340 RepID=UPI0008BCB47D|nr:TIGR04283 family arsenosugar biosynthesis glycosyltransferase [Nitrosovibrio sp. Nv6]SEP41281.1 transferase 2, rSAM/selenodomain-associated [Nitrosovibrio sp. Nv6]